MHIVGRSVVSLCLAHLTEAGVVYYIQDMAAVPEAPNSTYLAVGHMKRIEIDLRFVVMSSLRCVHMAV